MPKKLRYQERKKMGLCVDCSNKAIPEKAYCEKCAIRHSKSNKKRTQSRKSDGLCIKCGVAKEQQHRASCDACLKYMNEFMAVRRHNWESESCCVDCGANVIEVKRCTVCYLKMISMNVFGTTVRYKELLDLFNKQQERCKYTNRLLTFQVDCELDHIIPKSKGGGDVIDNLQWLHRDVNKMKYDLTEATFIASVKEIVNWLEFQPPL